MSEFSNLSDKDLLRILTYITAYLKILGLNKYQIETLTHQGLNMMKENDNGA